MASNKRGGKWTRPLSCTFLCWGYSFNWLERQTVNLNVGGSNPPVPAQKKYAEVAYVMRLYPIQKMMVQILLPAPNLTRQGNNSSHLYGES